MSGHIRHNDRQAAIFQGNIIVLIATDLIRRAIKVIEQVAIQVRTFLGQNRLLNLIGDFQIVQNLLLG